MNLKYETYCNAISDGSTAEWDFAWERYENSHVASEKSTILSALGCTKEVWLLNRLVLLVNICQLRNVTISGT